MLHYFVPVTVVNYRSMEGIRMTTEERIWKKMIFKSGVKGRESDSLDLDLDD